MRIGLDIDGVLGNFFEPYEKLIITMTGRDLFKDNRWPRALPPCWDWPQHYGYDKDEISQVWAYIRTHPLFWDEEAPLIGLDAARDIDQSLHDLYFITDRPGAGAQWVTANWLHERGLWMPSVIISRKGKGVAAAALDLDFYIDDKLENIQDVQVKAPEVRAYLLDYPYNRHGEVWRRTYDVAETLQKEGVI